VTEPKFNNPNVQPKAPGTQESHSFEVVKYLVEGGANYVIYFPTEQEAAKAIRDFWDNRSGSDFSQTALKSGMFIPIKHSTYTEGDRTRSTMLTSGSSEIKEHPGMLYKVEFNGNEGAIRFRGEETLRKLGFIE